MKTYRFMIVGGIVSLIAIFGLVWLIRYSRPLEIEYDHDIEYRNTFSYPWFGYFEVERIGYKVPPRLKRKIEVVYDNRTDHFAMDQIGEFSPTEDYPPRVNHKVLSAMYVSEYDKKGNLINRTDYRMRDTGYTTYKYDDKGNPIRRRYDTNRGCYSDSNRVVSKYDNQGREIETKGYNADGDLIGKATYEYDDSGKKTIIKLIQTKGTKWRPEGTTFAEWTYKYNDKGNVIEWTIRYAGRHSIINKKTFHIKLTCRYDNKEKLVEAIENYDQRGKSYSSYTRWSYEYNQKGNMIKKTGTFTVREKGKEMKFPRSQTTYEYEFYPEGK